MKYHIHPIIAVMALSACQQADDTTVIVPDEGRNAPVNIEVGIAASTRAVIDGTAFVNGNTYGLFVCRAGTYTAHNDGYNNMRATYSVSSGVGSWAYRYEGGSFDFPDLFIIDNDDKTAADFYAYSPWLAGTKSPEAVTFTLGGHYNSQLDMMYAKQNGDATNKDRMPGTADQIVKFTFHHVLSRLVFNFKVRNDDVPMRLTKMTLRAITDKNGTLIGAPLYNKATMNAISGTLYGHQETSEFTIDLRYMNMWLTMVDDYTPVSLLIVPTGVASLANDAKVYSVEFTFDNSKYPVVYDIPRSALIHSDNSTVGFQPGCTYTFNFTIDNYLHFDGVSIDNEWKDVDDEEIEV